MRTLPTTLALGGTAAAITAVLLRKHVLKQVSLALSVAKYSFMVFLIDMLPEKTRTEILSQEYTGEALEQRLKMRVFKGPRTVKALWRYSSINFYPQVAVGQPAPVTPVVALAGGREYTMLSELVSAFRTRLQDSHSHDPAVLSLGSRADLFVASPTSLWRQAHKDRPLVVNFGSCT